MQDINQEIPVRRAIHRILRGDEKRSVDWIDRAVYNEAGEFVEFQSVGRDVTSYLKKTKVVDIQTGPATP